MDFKAFGAMWILSRYRENDTDIEFHINQIFESEYESRYMNRLFIMKKKDKHHTYKILMEHKHFSH